ncbi:MAG TPA: hypothetical protein VJT50_15370 [Pyrinomonadaceae bacterium]|nr:hypothetical protein [Pyrinomonadaceae bacterium]
MEEAARSSLMAWETFFFLVGSSGAALTGLQFVVIALIAEVRQRATLREIDAFTTPTIVHFGAVLLVSALLSAPWRSLTSVAIALSACGVCGFCYTLVVIRRALNQPTYRLVFEDWLWHIVLPLIAYGLLIGSGIYLPARAREVLFVVGATALLLLFIGIHNAWDTVTYITVARERAPKETKRK